MLYAVVFQIIYEKNIWPKNTFIFSLIFIKLVSFTGTFIISSGCSLLFCMFLFYFIFLAEMISFSFYCKSASKKLRNSLLFCLSGNNLTWPNVAFLINNLYFQYFECPSAFCSPWFMMRSQCFLILRILCTGWTIFLLLGGFWKS